METYSKIQPIEEEISTMDEAKVLYGEYTLPPATTTSLGGVIVGDGLEVDNNGKISATGQRRTAEIILGAVIEFYEKRIAFVDYGDIITDDLIGKEIAKIEYLQGDKWIDIEDFNTIEEENIAIRANKTLYYSNAFSLYIAGNYIALRSTPKWFNDFSSEQIKVTYYTD